MRKRVLLILAGICIAVSAGILAGDAFAWRCAPVVCAPVVCAPVVCAHVVCAPVVTVAVPRPVICAVPTYCGPVVAVKVKRPWRWWCW